jgi:hypothetical protein
MTGLEEQLEALLDGEALSAVLQALKNVCTTRADHDEPDGRKWNAAAVKLARLKIAIERLGI